MRWRLAVVGLGLLGGLAFPAGAIAAGAGDEGFDPLAFTGPHFLGFYLAGLVMVVVAGVMIRRGFRPPDEGSATWSGDAEALHLDPYEIAYLAGGHSGPEFATAAAVTSLVQRGAIEVDVAGRRFARAGEVLEKLHPVEEAVYRATSSGSARFAEMKQSVGAALESLHDRLVEAGLAVARSDSRKAQVLGALPVLLWLGVGIAKIAVGLSRGKPVAYLVVLCIATGLVAWLFLVMPMVRTRRGNRVLKRLKTEYAALGATAKARADELKPDQLVMALGLFGVGILAGGPLANVRAAMNPGNTGTSCGGSGCGGGGGCGGGCGGCGGG